MRISPLKSKTLFDRIFLRMSVAWLVLIIAVSASLWQWQLTKAEVLEAARLRFASHTEQLRAVIRTRLINYEQILRGGVALFSSNNDISRRDWYNYTTGLRINENNPGIQGIGFAKRISLRDKQRHIAAVRAQGYPGYDIKPEGRRAEYFPVVYLEPFTGRNLRAFGYDMFSNPTRNAAMVRARDTGLPSATAKVILVQETEQDPQSGFLMYLPVYRNLQAHNTVAERRSALLGFIYGPFRMGDLIDGILGESIKDVDLKVYDGSSISAETLMYDHDKSKKLPPRTSPPALVTTLPLEVAGHTWTLLFNSRPSFEAAIDSRKSTLVLSGGLILSALLFAVMASLAHTRHRAVALANKMTTELRNSYTELQQLNVELESFSYSVSHDLRAPLRAIDGFSLALLEECGESLPEQCQGYLQRVRAASQRMGSLIDAMLNLSRVSRSSLQRKTLNLSAKARDCIVRLQQGQPERLVNFIVADDVMAEGDSLLMQIALDNLISNAWKFTTKKEHVQIEFGVIRHESNPIYFVRDNGAGFNMDYIGKLFGPFQRLHGTDEFDGTGIGLATVQRIISRHGGRIWAEGAIGQGATFYFTLNEHAPAAGRSAKIDL